MSENRKSFLELIGIKACLVFAGLVTLPAILSICGKSLWVEIVSVQVIATMATPILNLHWTRYGPTQIRNNSQSSNASLLINSIRARIITWFLLGILFSIVVSIFVPGSKVIIFVVVFMSSTAFALSNEWYYVSQGQYSKLFKVEVLPRYLILTPFYYFSNSVTELSILFLVSAIIGLSTFCVPLKDYKLNNFQKLDYAKKSIGKYIFGQTTLFIFVFLPVVVSTERNFDNLFLFVVLERYFRAYMHVIIPISQKAKTDYVMNQDLDLQLKLWKRRTFLLLVPIASGFVILSLPYMWTFYKLSFNRSVALMLIGFLVLALSTFLLRMHEDQLVFESKKITDYNRFQAVSIIAFSFAHILAVISADAAAYPYLLALAEFTRWGYIRFLTARAGI